MRAIVWYYMKGSIRDALENQKEKREGSPASAFYDARRGKGDQNEERIA